MAMNSDINTKITLSTSLHYYHWLVIFGSLILTFGASYISSQHVKDKMKKQFDYHTEHLVLLVHERMGRYEEALWAGVATLHSLPDKATREDWRVFASNLKIEKRFPGINGIGVIHVQTPVSLPAYLAWQRQLLPDYTIHPSHNKDEHWPITYIEPQQDNDEAVGLDIAHEKSRHTAAKKSRDSGSAQITEPIVLVQDEQKTPGFLFFAPWYGVDNIPTSLNERQEAFLGLVYAPFIMFKLMDGVLANTNRQVNFSLYDGSNELYNEFNDLSVNYDANPLLTREIQLDFYGRPWRFHIQSSLLFRAQHVNYQPVMLLVGGLVIDMLLFILFIVQAKANKRAAHYADLVSADLLRQQKELGLTHERLNSAMDAMMDALIVINEYGEMVQVNKATERIFGYERKVLLGRNIKMLMPHADAEKHDGYLARKTPAEANPMLGRERKLVALHAKGHRFPIRLNVTLSENQERRFYTGVMHDLSALDDSQHALEKSEGILNAAIQNAGSAFVVADREGFIIDVNPSLCRWLGYSSTELMGKHFEVSISEADREKTRQEIETLLVGNHVSLSQEKQFRHKSGSLHWGLLITTTVRDSSGLVQFVVAQIANIEEQKELQINLEANNTRLEEANRELNQFAYIASHDLKEPLRTLHTFTHYLLKDLKAQKWDRVAEDMGHVDSAIERMTNLITALLELSRAGNSDLHVSPVCSSELIQDVKNNLRTQLENSSAEVIVEDKGMVFNADRSLLTQMLQNLVSNAIKFYKPNHIPTVTIRVIPAETPAYGLVEIEDNGIGIEQDHLKVVFLTFKRLHGSGEYEGTGIGLSIVKKIVERHGGTITVSSTPGHGSCFSLRLPLDQTSENIGNQPEERRSE